MIDIDTETLLALMDKLSAVAQQIDEAAGLLTQVVVHDNWGCQERRTINDYILKNRTEVQRIQSDCHAFSAAAQAVTSELVDAENGIRQMFETLDSLIAAAAAEMPTKVVSNTGGKLPSWVTDSNIHEVVQAVGSIVQRGPSGVTAGHVPGEVGRVGGVIAQGFPSWVTERQLQGITQVSLPDMKI